MITVTVLGSNGWYENENGLTTCILMRTGRETIVLDAGSGLSRMRRLVDPTLPAYLFLSHLHLDHLTGFQTMSLYDFQQGLTIIAPLDGKETLEKILCPPFMSSPTTYPYPCRIVDARDISTTMALPFEVSALPLVHAIPDTGYRFVIDGKVIAFVLDTAHCDNAVTLAKDADLLITEAGFTPGQTGAAGHMDPKTVARLSIDANVKRTLAVHFGAASYVTMADRLNAISDARSIFPNLITGVDYLEVTV